MTGDSVSCGVSVVMATCGRPQFIADAIGSVVRQTFSNWELIIVHDGADDRTAEIVESWRAREPRIRYMRREIAGNIANASNFAVVQARGRYVAILDDDDYWLVPEKLSRQVCYLEANPQCLACGGGMVVIDAEGKEIMRYLKPSDMGTMRRDFLISNPMANSTVLCRRDAGEAVGWYDESLAKYSDWDFFLKLGARGNLYNFPDFFSTYRMWPRSASSLDQRANAASALAIVWRHRRGYPRAVLAVPVALAYWIYGRLPRQIRQRIFLPLSRMKKKAFSA